MERAHPGRGPLEHPPENLRGAPLQALVPTALSAATVHARSVDLARVAFDPGLDGAGAQPLADLIWGVGVALALSARDDHPARRHTGQTGQPCDFPPTHDGHHSAMPGTPIDLDAASELTRTGDIWLFRGGSAADRAIRMTTNSPVNHVGMSVVLDDLPPLMWHAELGRSLPDMWTGNHQRGVQLHDLRAAVMQWANKYGQRGWLRQLDTPVTREMEDGLLRAVARLDGTPFPTTGKLAGRWFMGRIPRPPTIRGRLRDRLRPPGRHGNPAITADSPRIAVEPVHLETAYCAEVVAVTYQMMGLLPEGRRPNYYDPGRFWSGDHLDLAEGFGLGGEIEIRIPAT